MDLFELILLSISLAMDAFAASICKGLVQGESTLKKALTCGLWFGVFQMIMPTLGYILGNSIYQYVKDISPWIAFILLVIIGLNMIREAILQSNELNNKNSGFDFSSMLILSIATSIDAFVVGFTFSCIQLNFINCGVIFNLIFAISIIGIITFSLSSIGVLIGNKVGANNEQGSEIAGGIILILIGIKVLFDYFGV